MKKRISLMMALMLVVLSIFSFGLKSNVKATGLTDEDIINIELNNIFVPNEVIFDFPLVTESAYNSSITWNSDNEDIIKIENGWAVVNRPTDSDKEVNLTVTITRGETSNSKTFNITVKQGVTETNTYNISYVLDGGVNNPNNPTTYKVGETTVLLPATKGTVEFLGWYLDGKKITSLPKGLSGDIELTAKWGAKQAVEMVIKNNVNKTEYNALETFDSTGLVLTVKYNDESELDISGNEITFDKTTLQGNDTIVTASYSGLSVEIEIKVNKLNISLEGLEFNGYKGIYDGKEHKVELVGQLPEGIKEVKYTDNVLTNAGTLTAKAEFVYDEVNYNNPGSLTTSIEIEKATLTVTVGNVTIKPGETPTYSYTIEGFVNNETADVLEGKVEYIETATDYNTPGTYPVGAKGLKSDNYEINYVQGILTITEEDYVIEAKDLTKVYNGENQTFTVVVKQGNTEVEDAKYIINNLDGSEFKGATNVGQYKVVISLVDEEAEELEVTFEITKANYELTDVEFKDVTTTFDGNVHKLEVTGLPEWLEVSYDKETTLVNAGSITVTASFNHNNPNYNEVTQTLTATLTINKAKLSSVTFEELEDVYYNGEAQEATIKGKLGNYELTQDDYDIAYEANTQIGTAKAILTGKGNFEGTATLTFEIKEADLSRVRRVKEALEKSYTELPTVFETVKEETNITWMSTSTALMINADGTYKEILTEKAQTVVVYAIVQYNNAVEYAKFEFVLSVKDSDTQIEIEGVNKDITINSTLLTDNQLANYTVEGQSVKYGYDINLLLENQEVQPEGKVTVRIPILEEYKDDETLKVYHVAEDGSLEDMNAVAENGYLVFETDSFSHYLVTVEAVEGEEPTIEKLTIAEFLAKEESTEVYYELTGTIKGTYNTSYGNFYLVDASGEVLVYGLTATKVESNDKSFATLGLKDGDVVTLIGTRSSYNNTPQVGGPAYYVSHTSPEYSVLVEVEGNGTATLSANKALNGTTVTLTVTPDDGNKVSTILVNNEEKTVIPGQEEYEIIVSSNIEIVVTFEEMTGDEPTESVYLYEFTAKQFATNETKELNGVNWTVAGDGGYWGYDSQNGKGQQFGSSKAAYTALTITSASFNGVSQIVINTSGASSTTAKLIVKVGGTQIGSQQSLTSTADEYIFTTTTPLTGEVVMEYTQTSAKAIYIKSIMVTYGGDSSVKPEDPETPEVKQYTVTFDGNDGEGSVAAVTVDENTTITLPENGFTYGGHTFVAWNTKDDGTGTSYTAGASFKVTENVTLYATWEEKSTGGEEEPDLGESTTVSVVISDYADANNWVNGTKYETMTIDSNITATATGSSNTGKYYTSGEQWRTYQTENPTITIEAKEGKTIVSVKITYASKNTGVLTCNGSNISSDTVVEVNASSLSFGVGNTGSATNGQVNITAIEVVYAGESSSN